MLPSCSAETRPKERRSFSWPKEAKACTLAHDSGSLKKRNLPSETS